MLRVDRRKLPALADAFIDAIKTSRTIDGQEVGMDKLSISRGDAINALCAAMSIFVPYGPFTPSDMTFPIGGDYWPKKIRAGFETEEDTARFNSNQ